MFLAYSLDGGRYAAKDNIDVQGMATTAATPGLVHHPARDAGVVARLRAAGATCVGKTNMHELSLGVTSNNPFTGPVRNPVDPTRVAGGSSGGSAAAVAAGEVDFALGTDTGGSVRIPAAFCGVWGFRPSTGRYPDDGVLGLSRSRDTVGLLARDRAVIRAVDTVVAREEPVHHEYGSARVGLPRWMWRDLDPQVEAAARAALDGVDVTWIEEEDLFEGLSEVAQTLVNHETLPAITRYLQGTGISPEQVTTAAVGIDVRTYFHALQAQPVPQEQYERALTAQAELTARYTALYEGVDLLTFPTVPILAPTITEEFITRHNGRDEAIFPLGIRNMEAASVVGSPSLSVPIPGGSLPVGLTFEAGPGADQWLLGHPILNKF